MIPVCFLEFQHGVTEIVFSSSHLRGSHRVTKRPERAEIGFVTRLK